MRIISIRGHLPFAGTDVQIGPRIAAQIQHHAIEQILIIIGLRLAQRGKTERGGRGDIV